MICRPRLAIPVGRHCLKPRKRVRLKNELGNFAKWLTLHQPNQRPHLPILPGMRLPLPRLRYSFLPLTRQ